MPMNRREKSHPAVVAMKPTNKAEQSAAERVEPRAGTKEKADQQSTLRTQRRARVTQALDRIRHAARQRKKERFTALFHHIAQPCSGWRSSPSGGMPRPAWMG